jgi:hypothetical protein
MIDISGHILDQGKSGVTEIIHWLELHVGTYLGLGEHPVMRRGCGWQILSIEKHVPEGIAIHWVVEIDDPELATLFALRWL